MQRTCVFIVCVFMMALVACAPAPLDSARAQVLLNEKYPGGTIDVIGVRQEGLDEAIAKVSLGGTVEVDVVFRRYDTGWMPDAAMVMGQEVPLSEATGMGAPIQMLMARAHRGRQRSTMADMLNIASANGTMRVDTGRYASSLQELQENGYLEAAPAEDGWGNAWVYSTGADTYTIFSLGSDGAAGPAAPAPWLE